MKRLASVLVVVAALALAAAAGEPMAYSVSVGTNSVMLLPPRNLGAAASLTATQYCSQGSVYVASGVYYWVVVPGTNATALVASMAALNTNGAAVLRRIPAGSRGEPWVIVQSGTNVLSVVEGAAAEAGAGVCLTTAGSSCEPPVASDRAVYGIVGSGSTSVSVQERD
jgi:hypothetical protein